MFTPFNRLQGDNPSEHDNLKKRWETKVGRAGRERVLALIREGAGEDFLQRDFEQGIFPFLKDMWDLRGLPIHNENFAFPDDDTFEAIDFSHAAFYSTTFKNAVFQSRMDFGQISGCTFQSCTFIYGHFYATWFGNCQFIECDFIDSCGFTNCNFENVRFESCFIRVPIFSDCKFDVSSGLGKTRDVPNQTFNGSSDLKLLADIYLGVSDAYRAGRVTVSQRKYLFLSFQEATRRNSSGATKLVGFFKEYLFGYGLRPTRPLLILSGLLVLGACWFGRAMTPKEAILLTAGALFTFGANADKLDALGTGSSIVYVILAFCGISLTSLFTVVLARVFFSDE